MSTVKLLKLENYLHSVKNSVDSKQFQILKALVDGKEKNLVKNGDLSCAYFVSAILLLENLIKERHATVNGTIRDMRDFGWKKISKPKIGCVLIWEKMEQGQNGSHEHIGFYIGEEKAVSNSSRFRVPKKHHWTFGLDQNNKPKRKIISMYWHPKLTEWAR